MQLQDGSERKDRNVYKNISSVLEHQASSNNNSNADKAYILDQIISSA